MFFQYNNPKSNPEESHSTQKTTGKQKKNWKRKKLLPRAGLLRIELQCQSCEESLETIRAADTIESLYQEIQRFGGARQGTTVALHRDYQGRSQPT